MGFNHGNRRAFGRTVSTSRVWILGRSHQSRKLVLFHLLVLMKTIGEKNDALEKKRISNAASVLDPKKKMFGFLSLYFVCIHQPTGWWIPIVFSEVSKWMMFLLHEISRTFKGLHESVWLYNCCYILQTPWGHLGASATSGLFNPTIVIFDSDTFFRHCTFSFLIETQASRSNKNKGNPGKILTPRSFSELWWQTLTIHGKMLIWNQYCNILEATKLCVCQMNGALFLEWTNEDGIVKNGF